MLNQDFVNKYRSIFGAEADAFLASLDRPRSRHIRLASSRDGGYLAELDELGIETAPVDGLEGVRRVKSGDDKLTDTLGFQTGGYYIMNPSSVFTADMLASLMPDYPYILDVSSAPGGKTCAIADRLGNRCAIIANEPSNKRMRSLQFNLEKYGAYSARTISMDGRSLHKCFNGFFDGILLDAPCSNENKIGRNKTVNEQWCQELTERMAKLQREIAESAFAALKPGGIMVYSTCTFSVEENEGVVKFLLDTQDCELVDINQGKHLRGISGHDDVDSRIIRFLPHKDSFDGFFLAAIRKKGGETDGSHYINFKRNAETDTFFNEFPPFADVYEKQGSFYLTTQMDRSINFSKNGIMLFKRKGELTSQALWQLGGMAHADQRTNIPYADAIRYLKGFDIEIPSVYHGNLLYYGDIPVGTAKSVQGMFKNKLDRYFLYGKNIEW